MSSRGEHEDTTLTLRTLIAPGSPLAMNRSLRRMRSVLFLLFSLTLTLLPQRSPFVAARTVTWLQSGGGNLQAASNWDSGAVPGPEDDAVIKLAQLDASSSSSNPARSRRRSDPWESDSASSRGDLGGGAMLTLMQGWSVRSLSVSGGSASLVADTQLRASGNIVVGRGAQLLVKGGTIEAARIDVTEGGTLSLDLGTVGNAQSRGGDPLQLRVQTGGTLLCSSGGGGSSNFAHSAITLSSGSQLLWDAGPLILDSSTLTIDSGATLFAKSEILTQGDASSGSATRINNAGRVVFDSSELGSMASQMLGVPLSNTGTMELTGPLGQPADLRVLNELKHEGMLSLTGSRTLSLSYSTADFGRNSRTEIDANATLLCQSGEAKFGGEIAAKTGVAEGGEIVISALASQSGSIDVNRIVMRGGTLDTATGATTTTKLLVWQSGSLGGEGSVSVGHPATNEGQLMLEEASGSKVLVGSTLHLYGSAWIRPSNTLLMQKSASIHVGPSSTLTHEEGSQLQSGDNSAVSMLLDSGSRWIFETDQSSSYAPLSALINSSTSAGDGDEALADSRSKRRGSRVQTVVSVPLSSQADLLVRGSGEAVFRRDARFQGLRSEDDRAGVGVRFQGLSNSTAFVFTHPISMPGVDQYLLLQSASLELQSHTKSALRNLVLLDGSLALLQADVAAGIEVQDTMVLGSPASSSKIEGKGPVRVRSMRLLAGKVEVEKVESVHGAITQAAQTDSVLIVSHSGLFSVASHLRSVSGGLVISSNGAKELNLKNLTLLSGSSSRIGPSQTRVGDMLHWSLQSNASLVIEGGAQLHASRPADATGQPCLRVEGTVRWIGLAGERASSSLEIVNLAQMEVVNRALVDRNGTDLAVASASAASEAIVPPYAPEEAFEAALSGGLKSVAASRLLLHAASALLSSCPQNLTDVAGCTFGDVSGAGGGRLHVLVGRHTMLSPVNVSLLSVENGDNSFRRQVVADKMEIKQGSVELLGYAFVNLVSASSVALTMQLLRFYPLAACVLIPLSFVVVFLAAVDSRRSIAWLSCPQFGVGRASGSSRACLAVSQHHADALRAEFDLSGRLRGSWSRLGAQLQRRCGRLAWRIAQVHDWSDGAQRSGRRRRAAQCRIDGVRCEREQRWKQYQQFQDRDSRPCVEPRLHAASKQLQLGSAVPHDARCARCVTATFEGLCADDGRFGIPGAGRGQPQIGGHHQCALTGRRQDRASGRRWSDAHQRRRRVGSSLCAQRPLQLLEFVLSCSSQQRHRVGEWSGALSLRRFSRAQRRDAAGSPDHRQLPRHDLGRRSWRSELRDAIRAGVSLRCVDWLFRIKQADPLVLRAVTRAGLQPASQRHFVSAAGS